MSSQRLLVGFVLVLLLVGGGMALRPSVAAIPGLLLALGAVLLELSATRLPVAGSVSASFACYLCLILLPGLGYGWAALALTAGVGLRVLTSDQTLDRPVQWLVDVGPIVAALAAVPLLDQPTLAGFHCPLWLKSLTALAVFFSARRYLPDWLVSEVPQDDLEQWRELRWRLLPMEVASGVAGVLMALAAAGGSWRLGWGVPLLVAMQYGLRLDVQRVNPEEVSDLDRQLLEREMALRDASADLERARQQLKRKFDDYATLQELARTLIRIPEVDRALDAILDIVERLVDCTSAVIFFDEAGRLVPVRFRSPHARKLRDAQLLQMAEPLVEQAYRGGEPLQLEAQTSGHGRLLEGEPTAAALPLADQGVLYVGRARVGGFDQEEMRTLSLVANLAPMAIQSAVRYEAQRRSSRLHAQARANLQAWVNGAEYLLHGFREMAATFETERLYDHLAKTLAELMRDCATAVVVLAAQPAAIRTRGIPAEGDALDLVVSSVVEGGRPLLLEEVTGTRFSPLFEGQRSLLAVPLRSEDEPLGLLLAASPRASAFSRKDQDLVSILAYQAAVLLQNAGLHQETLEAYRKLQDSQEQLVQSSKLTAIGQMAAGVAHELNTPLGAVMLAVDFALMKIDAPAITARLEAAVTEIQRAQTIVQKLLNFSRDARREKTEVDLNRLLDDTLEIIGYELTKSGVQVVREYDPLPAVWCVPNEIQQVVINLLLNARDAVCQGGGERVVTLATSLTQGGVAIGVQDTGPGISESEKEKIFEPFFTTKPLDKGTGLGLSVSRTIVEDHGGRLRFSDTPGGGATFSVLLPLS